MTESLLYNLLWAWIGIAVITFLALSKLIVAPFGRHTRADFGPSINNKWGWVIMESVSFFSFLFFFIQGDGPKTNLSYFLALLWSLHYFNRSFIYPFRQKDFSKKMPLAIMFSAVFFNAVNGSINGYFLGHLNLNTIQNVLPYFVIGLCLFSLGMYINFKSDRMLLSLRKPGEKAYQIPKGFLFKQVSCPNHLGEIIEWIGFAVMGMNLAALSFAIWTFANLAPRSRAHHAWYKSHFDNYPAKRKALVPFIW